MVVVRGGIPRVADCPLLAVARSKRLGREHRCLYHQITHPAPLQDSERLSLHRLCAADQRFAPEAIAPCGLESGLSATAGGTKVSGGSLTTRRSPGKRPAQSLSRPNSRSQTERFEILWRNLPPGVERGARKPGRRGAARRGRRRGRGQQRRGRGQRRRGTRRDHVHSRSNRTRGLAGLDVLGGEHGVTGNLPFRVDRSGTPPRRQKEQGSGKSFASSVQPDFVAEFGSHQSKDSKECPGRAGKGISVARFPELLLSLDERCGPKGYRCTAGRPARRRSSGTGGRFGCHGKDVCHVLGYSSATRNPIAVEPHCCQSFLRFEVCGCARCCSRCYCNFARDETIARRSPSLASVLGKFDPRQDGKGTIGGGANAARSQKMPYHSLLSRGSRRPFDGTSCGGRETPRKSAQYHGKGTDSIDAHFLFSSGRKRFCKQSTAAHGFISLDRSKCCFGILRQPGRSHRS
mmetsp:Transcript_25873/g.71049  ORF Transcript_25873/g.71049 Transcript_25873/m.71049 type:complete len:462 (-) Transcript_25873:2082-3467(-)